MDEQRQDDQQEPIYYCSVPIQDIALKTSREQWTIERGGERVSWSSVLAAWHDDDDEICPFGWCCRIHRLHLCREVRLPQRVSGYNTKQSDGKDSFRLKFLGIWNTLSLPSLPGQLWPGVVASNRVLSIGRIELRFKLYSNAKLNWSVWSFNCVLTKNCI